MALLVSDRITKLEKDKVSIHREVDCTYFTFTDDYGNKYLQLDTRGSSERKIKGKVSQD